jgi:hypothetical protein
MNIRISAKLMEMIYSIYARSLSEAQTLARSHGWASNQWISFILDVDAYARIRGAYDQTA